MIIQTNNRQIKEKLVRTTLLVEDRGIWFINLEMCSRRFYPGQSFREGVMAIDFQWIIVKKAAVGLVERGRNGAAGRNQQCVARDGQIGGHFDPSV